jgi:hypothetical protein
MGAGPGGASIACAAERRVERHVATKGYFESAERLVVANLELVDTSKCHSKRGGGWTLPARRYWP